MQLGVLENDKLYLEYCPDVGGSIFKFQAKVKDNKIDIFRGFKKRKIGKYSSYFSGYFSTVPYFGVIRKQSLFYKNKYISLKRTHPLEPDTIHGEANGQRRPDAKNSKTGDQCKDCEIKATGFGSTSVKASDLGLNIDGIRRLLHNIIIHKPNTQHEETGDQW